MHITTFLAAFLTLTWHLGADDPKPHLSYSYCGGGYFAGPHGWAQTKLHFANDFLRYSIAVQTDQCDYLAREVRGAINF